MATSSNLNLSIRALARDGWEPQQIADEFGVSVEAVQLALSGGKSGSALAKNPTLAKLEELGDESVTVIRELMHGEEVHPIVRLRAATFVAEIASGIKAPAKLVTPDLPAAGVELAKKFEQMQNAYFSTLESAKVIEVK